MALSDDNRNYGKGDGINLSTTPGVSGKYHRNSTVKNSTTCRRFLKILLHSTHRECSIQFCNPGTFAEFENVWSNFFGEHYHIFPYLKSFVGAINFIKKSIPENITKIKPTIKICNSFINLFTLTFLENSSNRETNYGGNQFFFMAREWNRCCKLNQMTTWAASLQMYGNVSCFVTRSLTKPETPRSSLICAEDWWSCRSPTQSSKTVWFV